jgi:hypothetical protein
MKIAERHFEDNGKLVVQRTFDPTQTIKDVSAMRGAQLGHKGESRHIGRVPGWLLSQWFKEAGVKWDDTKACEEVVKRKMLSGDFSAFRNWQGAY